MYGKRCRHCRRGILWIKRADRPIQVCIDPRYWFGEEYYTPKVHKLHAWVCKRTLDAMVRRGIPVKDPELVV